MSSVRVAVYRRTVLASLARVRENVLDWEHLPWLHHETFGHVRLLARNADGWRAEASLRGAPDGDAFLLDVAFEPGGLVYHSRTLTGRGGGTDSVTRPGHYARTTIARKVKGGSSSWPSAVNANAPPISSTAIR